jgi:deoxyadenosine/deoxycytidine kinase
MRVIVISGNIGAGKSTLIDKLNNVHVLPETVDEWDNIEGRDGEHIKYFQEYLENPERYAEGMQIITHTSKINSLLKMIKNISDNDSKIIITERFITDNFYVFSKSLHDEKKLSNA